MKNVMTPRLAVRTLVASKRFATVNEAHSTIRVYLPTRMEFRDAWIMRSAVHLAKKMPNSLQCRVRIDRRRYSGTAVWYAGSGMWVFNIKD
jgi:hypothetical protein